MARYVVDNSVWQRLGDNEVHDAFWAAASVGPLFTCSPQRIEYFFSALNPSDLAQRREALDQLAIELDDVRAVGKRAQQIQVSLCGDGHVRAVGAIDIMIAAHADINGATVLHYDSDVDHLARAVPGLATEWIVPRGSVD